MTVRELSRILTDFPEHLDGLPVTVAVFGGDGETCFESPVGSVAVLVLDARGVPRVRLTGEGTYE